MTHTDSYAAHLAARRARAIALGFSLRKGFRSIAAALFGGFRATAAGIRSRLVRKPQNQVGTA